jgi:hypothetical protein
LAVNRISSTLATATFTGRVTIEEITGGSILIDKYALFQVTLTDYSNKGMDTIGFAVWDTANQLYFSSNWNQQATVEQGLGGGNIAIH